MSYLCSRKVCRQHTNEGWFGSSVGLEQQPSKLRVMGSSPIRITKAEMRRRISAFVVPYGLLRDSRQEIMVISLLQDFMLQACLACGGGKHFGIGI